MVIYINGDIGIMNILGHSLDMTDKESLKYFKLSPNVVTIIFYKDKNQQIHQIDNLVKVIIKLSICWISSLKGQAMMMR